MFGRAPVAHSSGDALCQGQWGDEWNGSEGQTQVLHDANGDGQWDQLSFVLFVFYRLCLSTWIRGAICHSHTSLKQKPLLKIKCKYLSQANWTIPPAVKLKIDWEDFNEWHHPQHSASLGSMRLHWMDGWMDWGMVQFPHLNGSLFGFNVLQGLSPLTPCLFPMFCKFFNFAVSSAKDYTVITIAMVAVIALFGLAFIVFMVYKKKTRASTSLPQTLVSSS